MVDTDILLRLAHGARERGDFAHARRCLEQGAALMDAQALQALGYMLDVGEGGPPVDKAGAMTLYRQAWRRGSHAAAINIAILYREAGRPRLMFGWFARAARLGDGSAQLEMAKCYLAGLGVRKDIRAAGRCLALARTSFYISEAERDEALAFMTDLMPRLANGAGERST